MSKSLTNYFTFAVACFFVLTTFVTATSFLQLAIAIILYPALVYFAYKVLPFSKRVLAEPGVGAVVSEKTVFSQPGIKDLEEENGSKKSGFTISDIDKRAFLKIIGGTGVLMFIFSLFNKRVEGQFYKSMTGSSIPDLVALEDSKGNKINPAQTQPTDGYKVAEFDDGLVAFYGFINNLGSWYVMKIDSDSGSLRYARGDNNFPKNWSHRETLEYDYYNNVF